MWGDRSNTSDLVGLTSNLPDWLPIEMRAIIKCGWVSPSRLSVSIIISIDKLHELSRFIGIWSSNRRLDKKRVDEITTALCKYYNDIEICDGVINLAIIDEDNNPNTLHIYDGQHRYTAWIGNKLLKSDACVRIEIRKFATNDDVLTAFKRLNSNQEQLEQVINAKSVSEIPESITTRSNVIDILLESLPISLWKSTGNPNRPHYSNKRVRGIVAKLSNIKDTSDTDIIVETFNDINERITNRLKDKLDSGAERGIRMIGMKSDIDREKVKIAVNNGCGIFCVCEDDLSKVIRHL